MIDQIIQSTNEERFENAIKSEKPIRSVVKAISWRIVGTIDTILISWIITGEISMALTIGSIEVITKMILYFFHERLWNIIKWGK
ncbi:DUF2061 domain-containing protein [Lutibacter sp.]|uniref:DUF2061 domain-containing protein n=1 Tax=Lutibacter sp. TaxID=1925666 RepID=UPI002735B0CA|nr:DUF2061 domain-containing protein [Lutibacter sp.]MDP3313283.1 DUF2061 domain-containing protein [Lutibacter sp.]